MPGADSSRLRLVVRGLHGAPGQTASGHEGSDILEGPRETLPKVALGRCGRSARLRLLRKLASAVPLDRWRADRQSQSARAAIEQHDTDGSPCRFGGIAGVDGRRTQQARQLAAVAIRRQQGETIVAQYSFAGAWPCKSTIAAAPAKSANKKRRAVRTLVIAVDRLVRIGKKK